MSKQTVKCPKCDGRGKINFSNLAGGQCFTCYGAGKVAVDAPTVKGLLFFKMGEAVRMGGWALEDAEAGRDITHTCTMIATELFEVGTDLARDALADIRKGRYYDSVGRRSQAPAHIAHRVADRVIEIGREMRRARD